MQILFATDGSDGSIAAAHFLSRLGHHPEAHVHLLTASSNDNPPALQETRVALGDFAEKITQDRFVADSTSEIADGILSVAEDIGADLIVLGALGHSAAERFLLGSVAESVARHAHTSVLIARTPEGKSASFPSGSEVIIGIDGSIPARDAAFFAAGTALLPADWKRCLVEVVPPTMWETSPEVVALAGIGELVDLRAASDKQRAEGDLIVMRSALEKRGALVTTEMAQGDPAPQIIAIAQAHGAELIVVGARGLSGIERFFLGSVSDKLLWHAPCSVLVYRQPPSVAPENILPMKGSIL